MDIFLYFLFSTLEYCALQVLMFNLFRMEIYPRQVYKMIYLAVVLSNIDYTMKYSWDLGTLSLPVQLVFMILFVWLVFNIQMFYSFVITVISFAAYILFQLGVMHSLTFLGLYGLADGQRITNFETIRGQVITIAIALCISWILNVKHAGFSYVPDGAYSREEFNAINKQMLSVLIISIITLGYVSYSFWNMNYTLFLIVSIVLLVIFWSSIYISFKKESSVI